MAQTTSWARENIPAGARRAVDIKEKALTRISEEGARLLKEIEPLRPSDLIATDYSTQFKAMAVQHGRLVSALKGIEKLYPKFNEIGTVLELLNPDRAPEVRPILFWHDKKEKIVFEAVSQKLKADHPVGNVSSKKIRGHFVTPIAEHAAFLPTEIHMLAEKLLDSEFARYKSDQFGGFYFWKGTGMDLASMDSFHSELVRASRAAVMQLWIEKKSWLKRGQVMDRVQKVIEDRNTFSEGQKANTFIKYCTEISGDMMIGNATYETYDGKRKLKYVFPKLPTPAETRQWMEHFAQEDFLGRFESRRLLTYADAREACESNSIPDASRAYPGTKKIGGDALEMLNKLLDSGRIIETQDEHRGGTSYARGSGRRKSVIPDRDFY